MTATLERDAEAAARPIRVSVALLGIVGALWIASLAQLHVAAIGAFGLLSAFPITMYVAFGVLTVSMGRAVHREEPDAILAAHVVCFLLIAHGTPALLYETLRY